MFWPYAFISLSDYQPLNSRSSSLVYLDLAILQHKLGRAALACRKIVAGPGGGRKQNPQCQPLHIISDGNSHFPFNDSSYSGLLDAPLVVYASITYRIRASRGIAATDLPRELPLEGLYGGHHYQQF